MRSLRRVARGPVRAKTAPNRFPGDDLTGTLQQHLEELEGLFLKAERIALAVQFSGSKIELERAKADDVALRLRSHWSAVLGAVGAV